MRPRQPAGSNGFAISGDLTRSGDAMLLINPHTSFYFRGEVHVVSEEGLNAYGAVTWGQFFVYQGFSEKNGWMHTSTYVDFIDEFRQEIFEINDTLYYRYGDEARPLDVSEVTLKYASDEGVKSRTFPMFHTHQGPVTHVEGDQWVVTKINWDPVNALKQSFLRTKTNGHSAFNDMMDIRTNSSNNTVYAGPFSPKQENYPAYMAPDKENTRGLQAVRVLENAKDVTLDSLIEMAYDPRLTAFEFIIPSLVDSYALSNKNPKYADAIEVLRGWDYTVSAESAAMSLAHFYGMEMLQSDVRKSGATRLETYMHYFENGTAAEQLAFLDAALDKMNSDFGTWKTPWGEINRFQRLSGGINLAFEDSQPSVAVPMASGRWGALAAFGARAAPNTNRIYGYRGNSFIAVVEFGDKVKAKSLLAGGQSSDPNSPHFNDQIAPYINREFKDVAYYRDDVEARAVRRYRPGE